MAGKIQNTSQNINHSFTKGLNKDSDPSFVQDGMWTHARNAVNNTVEGDLFNFFQINGSSLLQVIMPRVNLLCQRLVY